MTEGNKRDERRARLQVTGYLEHLQGTPVGSAESKAELGSTGKRLVRDHPQEKRKVSFLRIQDIWTARKCECLAL